jgi:hypothetical protein
MSTFTPVPDDKVILFFFKVLFRGHGVSITDGRGIYYSFRYSLQFMEKFLFLISLEAA